MHFKKFNVINLCPPSETGIKALRAIDFLTPLPCLVCIDLSSLELLSHGKHEIKLSRP